MRSAVLIALSVIAIAGCAKQQNAAVQATSTATPLVAAAASATPTPAQTALPQAVGSETPSPTPSPTPTLTAAPDLLTFAEGAIMRQWPPTETTSLPAAFLIGADWEWKSRAGASGPFTFVFEFPVPTNVEAFEMKWLGGTPPPSGQPISSESVRFEGSSTGAAAGYTDLGTFQVKAGEAQRFPVTSAHIRWLRATIQAPSGQQVADLSELAAFGTPDANPANKPLAGTWLVFGNLSDSSDPVYASGKLPDPADWQKFKKRHFLWKVIQKNEEFRALECDENSNFYQEVGGTQDGPRVSWLSINGHAARDPGVLYPEGDVIVGGGRLNGYYAAMRLGNAAACKPPWAPAGHGKKVLVLTPDGNAFLYIPYVAATRDDPHYAGFRFIPEYASAFQASDLAGIDSVALINVCGADTVFAKWQSAAFNDFIAAGHKLIIHDSDACAKTGYAFLPYPFTTSNPGARGAHGKNLILVESSTLGSDRSDPAHFIDATAYANSNFNQLGDANTVTSQDSHWCGHLFGTNALDVNGFMHMFASYGRGLIIYAGFDSDDSAVPDYQKLLRFELQQKVPYDFKCTQLVTSGFLVSPSVEQKLTPGVAKTLKFPLEVLANQGYAGTVTLAAAAPPDAPWHTALSKTQVQLKGDTKPFALSLDVPAKVKAGRYTFTITGTDAKNQTAHATITLSVSKPALESALTKSKRIRIYGIHFDFNSATVRPESGPVIHEIADALTHHPEWRLTIEGHTDNVGGDAYNLDLSKRRAAAVKTILVAQYRIPTARLATAGYGATRPVASNETDAGRALNRRVELVRQ